MKIHGTRLILTVAVFAAGFTFLLHLVYAALFPPIHFYLTTRWTMWNVPMEESFGPEYMSLLIEGEYQRQLRSTGFTCRKDINTHICISNTQVIIQLRKNQQVMIYQPFTKGLSSSSAAAAAVSIKPYARQEDPVAMERVTPVNIFRGTDYNIPRCDVSHDVPAVVFSSGGFSGNLYHEFSEIVIPLFLTSHHFKKKVQFVITDSKQFLIEKYRNIFSHLSDYDLITSEDTKVHCFKGAVVGLKFHKNLGINFTELPEGYDMSKFRKFLRKSYSLTTSKVSQILPAGAKPVLLLISRHRTRIFLNEDKMIATMTSLGYNVIVADPKMTKNLQNFSNIVNNCSVIIGAHGAGLTNLMFLPAGAVVVQVVPLGLDWASNAYFGEPLSDMDLRYVSYKIEPEESSLMDVYGREHPVVKNPMSVFVKGYEAARATYVDGQNLKIDLLRLRETLIEVLKIFNVSEMSTMAPIN